MNNTKNTTKKRGNTIPFLYTQSRKWCFTLNNYNLSDINTIIQAFQQKKWLYIFGEEIAPTTGTPHLQGYLEHKNAIMAKTIKNIHNSLNLRKAKGNIKENYIYCSKDGKFYTNIKKQRKLMCLCCIKKIMSRVNKEAWLLANKESLDAGEIGFSGGFEKRLDKYWDLLQNKYFDDDNNEYC